ncbi:glycoside hydrolase family 43 protein [Rhizosphaericola mali]|uniref:Family 43 glycosylhydrolase n=1 Tax=Rhizosphaericola mali TaxID=2545455 RepID=A0A5P2FZK1_9BACT|nr:glycoside hydrolase family 43 protein [Rhizosphaericola mali]QES88645.1 family 43 glycosylhydrolase [Rhizosphaericola mali]
MKKYICSLALVFGLINYSNQANAQQTFVANGNPIVTDKYTADPAALVDNGTLYVFAGHDEALDNKEFYEMHEWLVYSTKDLKTWTAYPSPLNVKAFSWAKDDAWASQVIKRNGKYYWYVAISHGTIHGKSIGVAVSDNPVGPYKDALGKALITNDMTKETNISWDDIDPTVIVDKDGQAWLIWGNTKCYYAKLKPNMIELDGPIGVFDLPHYTEAPWINYRNGWYYLSYASGFPEKIVYAMSKNVTGPWTYMGILNELAGNSNTNHQAIVDFKGKTYFIYHNGAINTHGGSFRRSFCVDELHYNSDGTMKRIIMTSEGVTK